MPDPSPALPAGPGAPLERGSAIEQTRVPTLVLADLERERATRRLVSSVPNLALDRLVGLAARLLGTSSAQLSLLSDVQLIAGGAGVAEAAVGTEGPLSESLCTVTAASNGPLLVPDAVTDPRVSALLPVTSGVVGAYLGVPVRSQDDHVIGALCAYGPEARTWTETDVSVLVELAAAASTELELAALLVDYDAERTHWRLSMSAGGVGSFDWDLVGGELVWDSRLLEIFGYDRAEFDRTIDAFFSRLHADDVERVQAAMADAVRRCGLFEAEYRVVLPDGRTRWVQARGTVVAGADGQAARMLGAAYDTTAGRDADARVSRVLESMSAAFYSLDDQWRFSYVNAEAERLLGRSREELLGGDIWELFPSAVGSPFETNYRRAAETGTPAVFEAYYPPPLDGWYELRVFPIPDGLWVYFLDISARRAAQDEAEAERIAAETARASADRDRQRAEEALEEAETASRRLQVLARVSEDLSATLDAESAVGRLGHHLVPDLADWCIITLVGENGALRDVGAWHADDAMLPVLQHYVRVRVDALDPHLSFVARAIATGRPRVVPAPAVDAIVEVLRSTEAQDLLRELAPETAVALPLVARGRTGGLISLYRGAGKPPLSGADLVTAVAIVERAALALDNARLYGEQQRIAEGLQRALLTAPVEPVGMQIAVRYQPAAQAAQVGGDWYDAFQQSDGGTVLVIGDVMGHDIDAAAAMSQVRSLLRGIAYATGASPAGVLTALDHAIDGLQVGTSASAVVARLDRAGDGGPWSIRWSNAGHPSPLLVRPDGSVEPLSGIPNDLLLGIAPSWVRVDQHIELEPGSTVLLYTDGLVERRSEALGEGLDRLRTVVGGLAAGGLDALVDGVLAQMLPEAPEDDVAVVAVRLDG